MVETYITAAKKRCISYGLEPDLVPVFTKIPDSEFAAIEEKYENILTVVRFFMEKFISKAQGTPLLVTVTDDRGVILDSLGDESLKHTIAEQLGLAKGVIVLEKEAGLNVVSAALELRKPVQLIGKDHYHHFLHNAACYSAPFYLKEKELLGTISVMTFIEQSHPVILASLETVADNIERELTLLEQNKYLDKMNEMILEQTNTGYIVVEKNGEISVTNRIARSLLEKINAGHQQIQYFKEIHVHFQRVIKEKMSIRDIEVVIQHENDRMICLVDFFPFFEGVLIQIRDISDYKKTDLYIQNADKLNIVGQLAAGVAHEIKNPLTTLKGFVQLYKQQEGNNHTHTALMLDEIERINQITSELLVLSRPTVSKKETYDIRKLLLEIDVLLSSFAIEKNITIIKQYENVPDIYCDGNKLKQVFMNLFKNAVEAIPYSGEIRIIVQAHGTEEILVRFTDSGFGYPDKIVEHLGQPFITTKEGGNGLGLTICKRIVETVHDGKFNIYNDQSGKAVADIILPVKLREKPAD